MCGRSSAGSAGREDLIDLGGRRDEDFAVYDAILPPPRLVMATTDGRGGMSGLKSGQRVDGSSKVEGSLGGLFFGRMLDGDEQRLVVGREARPAQFGADRHAIEMPRGAARGAFGLDAPQPVGAAGGALRLAVGRDPQPALAVERRGCPACRTSRCAWCRPRTMAPTAAIEGSPHFTSISQRNCAAA